MAEKSGNVPVKSTAKGTEAPIEAMPERARHPLRSLRDEIDRLFEDFSVGFPRFPLGRHFFDFEPFRRMEGAAPLIVPDVDVTEKDDSFTITAEIPGMDEKNLEVSVADNVLTIKGEKREEKKEEEKGYYLSERRYGTFQRSFRLPASVDQDKIDAAMKNGVLTVMLPKTEEAKKEAKKITIKPQ